jgi:gliding motility-associated-like protein
VKEVVLERGKDVPFDTLDYVFINSSTRFQDYEVTLMVEKAGMCVIPSTNTYRIYPNPQPQFSITPVQNACDSIVFEVKVANPVGISEYAWKFLPEQPSNDTQIGLKDDHFYISYKKPLYGEAPKEYTIQLQARNFYGCVAEWTEKTSISPAVLHEPELALTRIAGNSCKPLKASFINNTQGNAVLASYELYVENQSTRVLTKIEESAIDGNLKGEFSYTFTTSGTFNVYLKAKASLEEGGECSWPLSVPVQINVLPEPVAKFEVLPAESCGVLLASISKTGLVSDFNTWTITDTETGAVVYGPNRYDATADQFNQHVFENKTNSNKQYLITLQAENTAGCTATTSASVVVHPLPKAYFNTKVDVCEPQIVTVAHQVADNAEDVSYTWIWGDGTTSTGKNPLPHAYKNESYTSALYYDLRLVAKTANGCVADSTIRISIQPKVKAAYEANVLAGCAPLRVYLTNKSKGALENQSGWYVREKGAADFSFVAHTLIYHEFENTSASEKYFELMYKAMNAGGCIDSVVKEIKVLPAILSDFAVEPSNSVYSNQKFKFVNKSLVPGVRYSWVFGDGSAPLVSDAKEVYYSYPNTSTSNNHYQVTLTAEDPIYGCKTTKSEIVTVYPAIQLLLTPKKDTTCLPEIPEFTTQVKNVSTHYWYAGLKNQIDYSRKLDHIYDAELFGNNTTKPLTYEVVYVGISAQGYKDSTKASVVVYPELKPSFTLDALNKQLPNAVFTIKNTTENASAWATSWSFGNGKTSNSVHPGSFEYNTFGPFTITLTVSNGYCTQSYAMNVQVLDAQPDVSFTMEKIDGCWPVTVQFKNSSTYADANKYFWDFGDGIGTSTAVHPTYTYNKPGVYKVSLQAVNRTGTETHSVTGTEPIRVYARPRADFEIFKNKVLIPEEPVYVANYSERGHWYQWDFGDGTIYAGIEHFEPIHYYKEPGIYDISLVVMSEQGCADTLMMSKAVIAEGGGKVTMPNAFTPNPSGTTGGRFDGSGLNDVFYPVIKGELKSYRLLIFNRWGELLYETNDPAFGWDGYYQGRLCKADVYIYKFSVEMADGKVINKIGDITLVR